MCRWSGIGRILLIPLVILSGTTLLLTGLAVGIVGIVVRLLTGRTGLITSGAQLIRAIDRLPFGLGVDRSHLYLICDEQGAVKIGVSHDPGERLRTLQTGHPEALVLLHSVGYRTSAAALAAERTLHHIFEGQRMNGEWFDLSDRQVHRAVRIGRRLR